MLVIVIVGEDDGVDGRHTIVDGHICDVYELFPRPCDRHSVRNMLLE